MPAEEVGNETVFVQLTPNQAQVLLYSVEESNPISTVIKQLHTVSKPN